MALAKKYRLNLRIHRFRVQENAQKINSKFFTFLVAPQPESLSHSRFAILLSKKLAKKAVERNKIRRKISQSIQESLANLPQHHDIILIPKKEILSTTSSQIRKDLTKSLSS